MKVFYDHQIFEKQKYGGISRYHYELIKGIESSLDIDYFLPILQSSNYYLKKIPSISSNIHLGSDYYNQFMNGYEFPGKWRLFNYWIKFFPQRTEKNKINTITALFKQNFDLFHPTDLDDYFLPYIGKRPFVITIHDMIDELFPEYGFHVFSTYKTSIKQRLVEEASGIITVSNSTKKDLIERFKVADEKIKVIYHGVRKLTLHQEKPLIDSDYLLYVGKRVHYKNFYFFMQAIQPILLKYRSLKVVCVGNTFTLNENNYLKDLGITNQIVSHESTTDLELTNLYQNAKAFVYPSLYEGFGLPILEAYQCGCPVLASYTSSLPEVAGDAALYFSPKCISSIQRAVETILNDECQRKNMIQKGYEQVKKFSWEKCIEQTVSFYKTIVR